MGTLYYETANIAPQVTFTCSVISPTHTFALGPSDTAHCLPSFLFTGTVTQAPVAPSWGLLLIPPALPSACPFFLCVSGSFISPLRRGRTRCADRPLQDQQVNGEVGSPPGPCWHDGLLCPGPAEVWDLVCAAALVLGTGQANIHQAAPRSTPGLSQPPTWEFPCSLLGCQIQKQNNNNKNLLWLVWLGG